MNALQARCRTVELIVSDVDGVLTDGGIVLSNEGIETKRFHIKDGLGIKIWRQAGGHFALITGRNSHIVKLRAAELGIDIVRQGTDLKLPALAEILARLELGPEQVCYIGDDLPDLAALRFAGLGVAVADACQELRQAAHYVTSVKGGAGAVRETIELILKSQQRWDDIVQKF